MIPCPHCDREFEKRSGLMRHVTSAHPASPVLDPVPVNPGGAIEPVVPVPEITPEDEAFVEAYRSARTVAEPETYAESLDELEPGQEPYVDPPVDDWRERLIAMAEHAGAEAIRTIPIPTPVRLTMDPTPEQYKRIRQLMREGVSRWAAWMTIVGHEPPPEEPQPPDELPVRLQQVRNRIYTSRTGQVDQIDARWLLQLAEIGADAIEILDRSIDGRGGYDETDLVKIIERWKAAIQ